MKLRPVICFGERKDYNVAFPYHPPKHYPELAFLGGETAGLTGVGNLAIDDGLGSSLTANVGFVNLTTLSPGAGIFNLTGTVNLTNIAYAGSNADLSALADPMAGVVKASFLAPGQTLSTLVSGEVLVGQYIGTLMPVPEPSAALCFAVGSLVVGAACRRRR